MKTPMLHLAFAAALPAQWPPYPAAAVRLTANRQLNLHAPALRTQRIRLDTELIEFVCNRNEKSVQHLVGK